METGLIWLFAFLYVLANKFIAPFFYSREKLQQYRKEYMEAYKDLLKAGINASEEELQKKQERLMDISQKQMKESLKSMAFTLALFFAIYAMIDFIYPPQYSEAPIGDYCIAYGSNGHMYMYENGTLKTIEFIPFFTPKEVNVNVTKYECGEPKVDLPVPIGSWTYVWGYKRIFILYLFVASIVVGLIEYFYKTIGNYIKKKGP